MAKMSPEQKIKQQRIFIFIVQNWKKKLDTQGEAALQSKKKGHQSVKKTIDKTNLNIYQLKALQKPKRFKLVFSS